MEADLAELLIALSQLSLSPQGEIASRVLALTDSADPGWMTVAVPVLLAFSLGALLALDRLERIFVALISAARWSEEAGWTRLAGVLEGMLWLSVAHSYRRPLSARPASRPGDISWFVLLHRSFLVLHGSDVHYPRCGRWLRPRAAPRPGHSVT